MIINYVTNIGIKNFCGITKLELNNLDKVNLILGKNNCGKSSVLKAIKIGLNTQSLIDLKRNNKTSLYDLIKHDYAKQSNFEITLKQEHKHKTLELTFNSNIKGELRIRSSDSNDQIYEFDFNKYEKSADESIEKSLSFSKKEKKELIELLQYFDKSIINIEFNANDIFLTEIEDGEGIKNLNLHGSGIKRIILLVQKLKKYEGKIILIDQFELGLHYGVMRKVLEFTIKTCLINDTQLFLTSQNIELINYLLDTEIILKDLKIITLYKKGDKNIARVVNKDEALRIRDTLQVELR